MTKVIISLASKHEEHEKESQICQGDYDNGDHAEKR
jgi:hypothetical protein